MSRLSDIIDNHQNLDQLFSIFKHYGISAEFISAALIEQLDQVLNKDEDNGEEADLADHEALLNDMKQYYARF